MIKAIFDDSNKKRLGMFFGPTLRLKIAKKCKNLTFSGEFSIFFEITKQV